MNVKDKIVEVTELLDEIDEYDDSLSNTLSNCDSKVSDLYHLAEKRKLKTNECYRFVQEFRKVLLERRKVKNDMLLLNTYRNEKQKLISNQNRTFLKQSIFKKYRELKEAKYNNRIYTEEEIEEILGGMKNEL